MAAHFLKAKLLLGDFFFKFWYNVSVEAEWNFHK